MSTKLENATELNITSKMGILRSLEQIYDTFIFEIQKSLKRALILLGVVAVIFGLNYYLNYQTEQTSAVNPYENPIDYIQAFMGFVGMIILIIVIGFGSQMLVVDFEQETGNILFPKISRGKIMIGRFTANFVLIAAEVLFFYISVGIASLIKFNLIPKELWQSFGWAIYYAFMVLSMTVFFSSFMRRSTGVIVTMLLLMLIGFDIVQSILGLITAVEPLFLPSYYRYIISNSLDMPTLEERKMIIRPYEGQEGMPNLEIVIWQTPNFQGAAIGLAIFSIVFLTGAYIFYRYRQNK